MIILLLTNVSIHFSKIFRSKFSSKIKLPKKLAGFSLIEVVISCAILAGLGITMIQSQMNSTQTISRMKLRSIAQEFINSKLQELERDGDSAITEIEKQEFPENSVLFPGSWSLIPEEINIFNVPMLKVVCKVNYMEFNWERTLSGFIVLDAASIQAVDDDGILEFIKEQLSSS